MSKLNEFRAISDLTLLSDPIIQPPIGQMSKVERCFNRKGLLDWPCV
jgi:hypothetical protein